MKKSKNKKRGFTLVELLAVIIILAIVVGITIPAVLTTTNKTKKKAFQTSADTMADWIDRQYQVYKNGLNGSGMATLDETWEKECVKGAIWNNRRWSCDEAVINITSKLVEAAGIKSSNVTTGSNVTLNKSDLSSSTMETDAIKITRSKVYINPETGRSCVTLLVTKTTAESSDYTAGIRCGGVCTSDSGKFNYCVSSDLS